MTSVIEGAYISTHDLTRRSTSTTLVASSFGHISTHDLTRRSTCIWLPRPMFLAFQLTTSRGGRPLDGVEYIGFSSFQLTTSRGGRQGSEDNERRYHNISTHDLARRSTKADLKPKEEGEYFNSRPREEVDQGRS